MEFSGVDKPILVSPMMEVTVGNPFSQCLSKCLFGAFQRVN